MSSFMASSKSIILKSQSADIILESNVATTIAVLIYERMQDTPITDITYQLEKISGRDTTVVQAWTAVSMVGVEDNIYTFDITTTEAVGAKLLLRFKIVDIDGVESFKSIGDITVTA